MTSQRPLSPHLQIYRPQVTSVLSIFHRFAGIFLTLSFPFLVFFLWMLSIDEMHFNGLMALMDHWMCKVFILKVIAAISFYLPFSVRHLVWDAGYSLDLENVYISARIGIVAFVGLLGLQINLFLPYLMEILG